MLWPSALLSSGLRPPGVDERDPGDTHLIPAAAGDSLLGVRTRNSSKPLFKKLSGPCRVAWHRSQQLVHVVRENPERSSNLSSGSNPAQPLVLACLFPNLSAAGKPSLSSPKFQGAHSLRQHQGLTSYPGSQTATLEPTAMALGHKAQADGV